MSTIYSYKLFFYYNIQNLNFENVRYNNQFLWFNSVYFWHFLGSVVALSGTTTFGSSIRFSRTRGSRYPPGRLYFSPKSAAFATKPAKSSYAPPSPQQVSRIRRRFRSDGAKRRPGERRGGPCQTRESLAGSLVLLRRTQLDLSEGRRKRRASRCSGRLRAPSRPSHPSVRLADLSACQTAEPKYTRNRVQVCVRVSLNGSVSAAPIASITRETEPKLVAQSSRTAAAAAGRSETNPTTAHTRSGRFRGTPAAGDSSHSRAENQYRWPAWPLAVKRVLGPNFPPVFA